MVGDTPFYSLRSRTQSELPEVTEEGTHVSIGHVFLVGHKGKVGKGQKELCHGNGDLISRAWDPEMNLET